MLTALIRRLCLPACALLLLAGCSAPHSAPEFQQTYGVVDAPCAPSKAIAHCTAHVVLVNRGAAGIGHATIVVAMKGSGAATSARVSSATCGTVIPDTPTGGYVDLTCSFDLPPGRTIAADPGLSSFDFLAASVTSAPDQTNAVGTLIVAAVAALIAVATLAIAIARSRQ